MSLHILDGKIMQGLEILFDDKSYCSVKGYMDKFSLCRAVLNLCNFPDEKSKIFLISSIIELFGGSNKLISLKDITNYFIDEVIHTDEKFTNVEQRYMYKGISKIFPNLYNSTELEKYTPLLFGYRDQNLRRFEKDK